MLQLLVGASLRRRWLVAVLAAMALGIGIYACGHARLDVFPEFAPPQVVLQTEAPGLSAREVEQLVTTPIEAVLNGVPRLELLRSESIQGLSVITAIFDDGTDIYRARQQVSERLGEIVNQLPAGVKSPRLAPLTSSTGRLLTVGFTSATLTPLELRERVQWAVRPRLLSVRGVAQVTVLGGGVRQFQVQVEPKQLAARNLTISDVVEAARQASGLRGAGFLENDRQRITLRTEGQVRSAAELGETVVAVSNGNPVRLKDVADVAEGPEPKFGDAAIDGTPGVLLVVSRQLEADTVEVTRRVESEVNKLRPLLERQGLTLHTPVFRQANFIDAAIGNVTHSLLLGVLFVAGVLLLFLFNLRTAFISLTAIPLSLLCAITILWGCGVGLNTLTLGGLAIAVGEVVDDAIIDVENIYRRLRENTGQAQPRSPLAVVLAASLEVRTAVVYATFIVVLAFVPVFLLSGIQGRLFAPLGYAYVLAVLASLLVALTVTPALSLLLLPAAQAAGDPPFLRGLHFLYDRCLRLADRCWLPLLGALVLVLALAVAAFARFGGSFLPELRENHFVVHMRGLPGTSLQETLTAGADVTRVIKKNPAVLMVVQAAGRAELGEDTWGVEYSEIEVPLRPQDAAGTKGVEDFLSREVRAVPGCSFEVYSFLSERIKEVLSGSAAAVVVKVQGDNLDHLQEASETIARMLKALARQKDIRVQAQTGAPEVVVRIDTNLGNRFGLRRAHVLDAVHTAFQGAEVGQVYVDNRVIDIRVLLDPKARRDLEALKDLEIALPRVDPAAGESAGRIQLRRVAQVYLSDGRFLIAHEGGVRQQKVTCNVDGGDVASFVRKVEEQLAQLHLPAGVTYTLAGEHLARSTSQRELVLWSGVSGVGIVLLLGLAFGSVGRAALVLVNLPFALVGGVAAVALSGGMLDVGSLIGFVTLFGITMRNSMMLVAHWQHLREVEQMPWGRELIFRGARERLAPVLMTALVTGLGLLPIALGSGEAGREIEGPMAWVILGGLISSTVLNLLVFPVLYRKWSVG